MLWFRVRGNVGVKVSSFHRDFCEILSSTSQRSTALKWRMKPRQLEGLHSYPEHFRSGKAFICVTGRQWITDVWFQICNSRKESTAAIVIFYLSHFHPHIWLRYRWSHFNSNMSDALLETICISGTRPPYKRPAWVIGQVGSEELQRSGRAQTATPSESRDKQTHPSTENRRPK